MTRFLQKQYLIGSEPRLIHLAKMFGPVVLFELSKIPIRND